MLNFLKFSQIERLGIVSLLLLSVLIFCAPYYFPNKNIDLDKVEIKELDQAHLQLEPNKQVQKAPFESNKKSLKISNKINPNSLLLDDWVDIGIPENIAERICKYTSKGGKFKSKNDLLKIYGFKTEWFKQIEPYLEIENIESNYKNEHKTEFQKVKTIQVFDINTAESTELQSLKGIGQVLANRIIKYRNKLGGFVSMNQLSEVYGLAPEVIIQNQGRFMVNNLNFKKINLYAADFKQLSNHPYFGYKNTKIWIAYRNQHADLKSIDELLKVRELKFDKPEYLEKYFNFN